MEDVCLCNGMMCNCKAVREVREYVHRETYKVGA